MLYSFFFLTLFDKNTHSTQKNVKEIINQISPLQLIAAGSIVVLFIIQIIFVAKRRKVVTHRHKHRLGQGEALPPVSVVVVIGNEIDYLYEYIPVLLEQDHPEYEIVIVNDCGGTDVTIAMEQMAAHNPKIKCTTISKDDKFNHSRKMPLMVGIKAAKYDNIVMTHSLALPTTNKWLSFIARGFVGADIVISYNSMEQGTSLASKIIRASDFHSTTRALTAACNGKAYKASMCNMGYTKNIFFKNGFSHLRLSLGEDDLFIQRIATKQNVAVIINPHCTTKIPQPGNIKWWWENRKYFTYVFKFYPQWVKNIQAIELTSRLLYFAVTLLLIVMPLLQMINIATQIPELILAPQIAAIAFGLFTIREITMLAIFASIAKRVGDKGLLLGCSIYDKIEPLTQPMLAIARRTSPPAGLWL